MRVRFMRIILFFDLPMESSLHIKNYTRFRKFLIKEGFIMMQKSVYSKLVLNASSAKLEIKKIKSYVPDDGFIQILTVTEKQFASIENLSGKMTTNQIDTTERVLFL